MTSEYFVHEDDVSVSDCKTFCQQSVNAEEYPLASEVISDVLIYDRDVIDDAVITDKRRVLSELHKAFSCGPGVMVVRGLYPDAGLIDRASQVFDVILREEAGAKNPFDHFSRAGNNGRILHALQKLAEADPALFTDYYANTTLGLICHAWLGPSWRMASQINQVRPGAAIQQPDHPGFQPGAFAAEFPIPIQILSQYLTLQGAIAHTDMPLESGPTRLLPWSHQYELGYIAYRRPEFVAWFNDNAVQIPLRKGDGLFFNPALFHASGNNITADQVPTANLLQISSAFGVPMEEVNHERILQRIYPLLLEKNLPAEALTAVIRVAARGFAFPTHPDTDAPVNQQQLVREALAQNCPAEVFNRQLAEQHARRQA